MVHAVPLGKRMERTSQNATNQPTVKEKRCTEKQTTAAQGAHRYPQRILCLGRCATVDIYMLLKLLDSVSSVTAAFIRYVSN